MVEVLFGEGFSSSRRAAGFAKGLYTRRYL